MDSGILAARRQLATERLAAAANTIGTALELDAAYNPAPAKDAGVKLLYQLEAAADLLDAVAAKYAPAPEATESAAEVAELSGIDLATVEGTGAGGKVLKSDVLTALDKQVAAAEAEPVRAKGKK